MRSDRLLLAVTVLLYLEWVLLLLTETPVALVIAVAWIAVKVREDFATR